MCRSTARFRGTPSSNRRIESEEMLGEEAQPGPARPRPALQAEGPALAPIDSLAAWLPGRPEDATPTLSWWAPGWRVWSPLGS